MEAKLWDNGGRRRGLERRQFNYAGHVPEWRSGRDRRRRPRLGPEHRKDN